MLETTEKTNFTILQFIWKEFRHLSVFCKSFQTDTDNELGRFLESFTIVKEKNKLKEACAVEKEKESAFHYISFSFQYPTPRYTALQKLNTEANYLSRGFYQ